MSSALAPRAEPIAASRTPDGPPAVGPIGRLGSWTVDHVRAVAVAWALALVALGVFAPSVESALSGAGWQANGSESVRARQLIQQNFAGLSSSALTVVVHSGTLEASILRSARPLPASSGCFVRAHPSRRSPFRAPARRSPPTATRQSSRRARTATPPRWWRPPTR